MDLIHLAIYPVQDLVCPSPYKGGYPAALPSPTIKGGMVSATGVLEFPEKALRRASWQKLPLIKLGEF